MIPYFSWQTIEFGPLTIQVWGLFVSLGAVVFMLVALKLAKLRALSKDVVLDLFVWGFIGGLVGARAFYMIFYEPGLLISEPAEIIRVWHGGASSLGGLFGAAAAFWIYFRKIKMPLVSVLSYLDVCIFALWPAWAIGRIGCFMIHDHIGRLSNFFLAVNFPGGARLDLGLFESLLAVLVFFVCLLIYKKAGKRPGFMVAVSLAFYSFVRFFMDFLRATDFAGADARYAGLTPAQWGMATLFFILMLLIPRIARAASGGAINRIDIPADKR